MVVFSNVSIICPCLDFLNTPTVSLTWNPSLLVVYTHTQEKYSSLYSTNVLKNPTKSYGHAYIDQSTLWTCT